ncbi:MAG TPA: histidine phosphatase family protein [Gaiellaceae bacterium]|nr:histidine phosphatase family protein [Gaiellaceae bacterium]HEX2495586.1 histidine phosphatase family protein [Gaiellaceae bacterium]
MERAIFVRHGESEYSAKELVNGDPSVVVGLTEEGKEQARWLYDRLEGEPIDLCVVTQFGRTRDTANIALGDRQVPRVVVKDLNDPFYGAFEGGSLAEYRKWAGTHGPLDAPPGGGEARVAIAERYARGFRFLLGRPEDTILVVCHSLPIAFALAAADGRAPSAKMPLVTPAEPHVIYEPSLRDGVERLEAWLRDPAYP